MHDLNQRHSTQRGKNPINKTSNQFPYRLLVETMRKRLYLHTVLASLLFAGSASGQDSYLFSNPLTTEIAQTTYVAEDEDGAVEDDVEMSLAETVARLELRIRELENDFVDRSERWDEASEESGEQSEEFGERLDDIEETIEDQDKSIEKFTDALPGIVFHGHKNPKMQFFGRIHLDYWAFPKVDESLYPLERGNPQDRVAFRRMRIGVKGDLFDNVFYKYEGEFAGGVDSQYRDAYFGFEELPYLNTVIIGNHKRPYGLDHLNSSRHNIFIERPFIVESLNQDARRLGMSTNGVSEDQNTNWRFGVWNQELTQDTVGWINDHYQLEVAGRIAGTPWYDDSSGGRGYLHLAISGSFGQVDENTSAAQFRTRPEARSSRRWLDTGLIPGAEETALVGLEALLNIGAFQLSGEFMRHNVDRADLVGNDLELEGGYVQAAYFLTGEHMPWNRTTGTVDRVKPFENFFLVRGCDCETKRGWGAWQVASRYSWADLSDEDILGGEGQSLTLGLNWLFNPYSRMQFNYINGDIFNNAVGVGNYEIFGVRMMVDF